VSAAKAIVQLVVAVLAAILPSLLVEEPLGLVGWVNVIVLGAGAIHVFNSANSVPGWPIAKAIASAVAAIGVVLISALADSSIDAGEWVQVITALLGAGAVYAVPNRGVRHVA
jgi:hypothetical protein